MSFAAQFPLLVALLTSAIISAAWWYAVVRKPNVPIFYWMAAVHSLSCGLQVVTLIYALNQASSGRWVTLSSLHTLVTIVMAGLYVTLARWLVKQP